MNIVQMSEMFIARIIELFGDVKYTNELKVCGYEGVYRCLRVNNPQIELSIFNKNSIYVYIRGYGTQWFAEDAIAKTEEFLLQFALQYNMSKKYER